MPESVSTSYYVYRYVQETHIYNIVILYYIDNLILNYIKLYYIILYYTILCYVILFILY